MLRALRRWWESHVASIPRSEVLDSVPESQWDQADLVPPVSKGKRKAFTQLLTVVFAHLPPQESEALVQRGGKAFTRADEVDTALRTALFPDEIEGEPRNLGFIACDWKAVDEVQWQADRLCQAHRTSGQWSAPEGDLQSVLESFDSWLQSQGRSLLCFADGDSLLAFAVPTSEAASAVAIGKKLKLAIRKSGED